MNPPSDHAPSMNPSGPDDAASVDPQVLARVDRVREELRRRVRGSATNQRQIERHAGWSRGYLSQVLQGHISLTVLHVMTVLEALDTPPERFFVELFGSEPAPLDEIRQKLATYDAAFRELRERGLISGTGDSGTLGPDEMSRDEMSRDEM